MGGLRDHDYRCGELALRGQLALPEGPGPHPAVMVMHDGRGLGEQARRRALMLAEQGYVALATDMYGGGVRREVPREAGELLFALQGEPQELRRRVLAGFEAIRAVPGVDPARVGAVGFCFGGQCVLELARSGADAKAVVSFHGILTSALPAEPGAVKPKVLVLTGAKDPFAPLEHVESFRQEMSAAGADWQVTLYSEGWHAFTDPGAGALTDVPGVKFDPLLDRLSWASALALLDATLR